MGRVASGFDRSATSPILDASLSLIRLLRLPEMHQKRCGVVLQVYLDQSGKAGDDFICLCGYVASDEGWVCLTHEWQRALDECKIHYVHMAEMWHRHGECEGWKEPERDVAVRRFSEIFRRHAEAGFAIGFDAKYFREMANDARQRTRIDDAATFCFKEILGKIFSILTEWGYTHPVSVVLDDDEKYSIDFYKLWRTERRSKKEMGTRIVSITSADDRFFAPLQAADMLAWLTNRYLCDRAAGKEPSDHFFEILESPEPGFSFHYKHQLFDRETLDWMADHDGQRPDAR